jgi:hypothetical protein
MDNTLLDKYLKVKALAEKGSTDGERAAAAGILAGMETKHPGIREAAEKRARAKAPGDYGDAAGTNPFPGFPFADLFGGSLGGLKLTPDDVIRAYASLRELFGESEEAGDESGDREALALREVAQRVEVSLKQSRKGEVSLYARLTPETLDDAADAIATPEHAAAFAAIIGARVADTLREALVASLFDDDEDDDEEDDD